MTPLIQLPSGDWVRPDEVRSIHAYEANEHCLPRVVIHLHGSGHGGYCMHECVSMPDAIRVRDEVAQAVNAARSPE